MSCYLHQHKSTDCTKPKWTGDVHKSVCARQVAKNVSYTGIFLGVLASLAARALPTILSGLTSGLLSGGINKAISGSGAVGDGLYLHKHDKCY